jgi:hypothetical protein
MRIIRLLLFAVLPAFAQEPAAVVVLERNALEIESQANASHRLALTLAYFRGGGWEPEAIRAAVRQGAQILGRCGVALELAELVRMDAPERYRYLDTPASRALARALPLRKPVVYFVLDTRNRPAFDAEAIGRGNSRSRPELQDTVWITRGARDPGIVLAHELAHVLMDSGAHSEEPGNLMRAETTPENTRLSADQCARLRDSGSGNGLLAPR